jgi:hypothetical protein
VRPLLERATQIDPHDFAKHPSIDTLYIVAWEFHVGSTWEASR